MTTHTVYDDWQDEVHFGAQGPQPTKLVDEDGLRTVLVGLRAGQQIPVHPAPVTTYHVISGTGSMTIAGDEVALRVGTTVVVGQDQPRGVTAATDLVFIGSQPPEDH